MTNGHPIPIPADNGHNDYGERNRALMERELLGEILPFVESTYPVQRKARDRAIVGLSMGGGQSLSIGLGHPEIFGWVGGFSSGVPTGDLAARFATLLADERSGKGAPALVWIGVGRDDFLLKQNQDFHAWLEKARDRRRPRMAELAGLPRGVPDQDLPLIVGIAQIFRAFSQ
jgi:enterochelin esterase family protein